MRNWVNLDAARVFAIPLTDEFGGSRWCEGVLIEGPQGWGEFSPPRDCGDRQAARCLTAALEAGTVGWPDPVRGRVPVAVVVPAVSPQRARDMVAASGCRSASVEVAASPDSMAADIARLEAVRDAVGPSGSVRADANGSWDLDTAVAAVPQLDRAAGGLEFIEQPCGSLAELAALRPRLAIPVAVDESIREAEDPAALDLREVADIAVLTVSALGGVRRALRVAEACGVPCVAGTTLQSSVGLAGGLALAGVLPETRWAGALAVAHLLAGDVVGEGRSLIPVDGFLPVAPMPAAPDPVRLERFAPADPEKSRQWRSRLSALSALL